MTESKASGQDMVCKNHNARTEKDIYRVCPAKVSKHELDDLYFALLESNLDLKKTVNNQKEKIRELSTKVQRMTTVQRCSLNKEQKECCVTIKAVCNEQRETIADLKKNNEHLTERIKLLNMKLCSAKQFLQRNPLQSTSKCPKCCIMNISSLKNSSTSALNSKRSDNNLKLAGISCQYINNKEISTTSVQTEVIDNVKNESDKLCDENKCKTQMEEFKQKIISLQEELSKPRNEYSIRITKLENEVCDLRKDILRLRSEKTASEHSLQQNEKKMQDMADRLRQAEVQYTDLAMELSIERRKVVELETFMKSTQMSNSVITLIAERLNANETMLALLKDNYAKGLEKSPVPLSDCDDPSPRVLVTSTPGNEDCVCIEKDSTKISKSDDSGYIEGLNKSQEASDNDQEQNKINEEIVERIDNLQVNLDKVKKKFASIEYRVELKESNNGKELLVETDDFWGSNNKAAYSKSKEIELPKNLIESKEFNSSDVSIIKSKDIVQSYKTDNDTREQSPDPIHLDVDNNCNKTNKKRLSNVDKFIKNYYKRKSSEASDTKKVYKQISGSTNESKSLSDNDRRVKIHKCADSGTNIDKADRHVKMLDKIKEKKKRKTGIVDSDEVSKANSNEKIIALLNEDGVDEKFNKKDKEFTKKDLNLQDVKVDGLLSTNNVDCSKESKCNMKSNKKVIEEDTLRKEFDAKSDTTLVPSLLNNYEHEMVDCGVQYESGYFKNFETQRDCKDHKQEAPLNNNQTSQSSPRTYTVEGANEISEHDTDCEISSMTDLPSENEKYPREVLSPGENKLTATYTDSCTSPYTTDYRSLSEGELPGFGKATSSKLSQGEKPKSDDLQSPHTSSSLNMEETLQDITQELARCKQLLLSLRPKEVNSMPRLS